MSLLNEVLQDLDERAAGEPARPVRLAEVPPRHLGQGPKGAWPERLRPAVWPLLGVAAALAAWLIYPPEGRNTESRTQVQRLSVPASPHQDAPARIEITLPVDPASGVTAPPAVASSADDAGSAAAELAPETSDAPEQPAALEITAMGGQASSDGGEAEAVVYLPLRNTEVPPLEPQAADATEDAPSSGVVKTVRGIPLQPLESARQAIAAGELAKAEALLRDRLRSAPADRGARELLIGLMLRGERAAEALQQLEAGLGYHPQHLNYILIKARLLSDANQLDAATALLERAPPGSSERPQTLQLLAALYQQQGRAELAVERYRELVALRPAAGDAWMGLAVSLDSLGSADAPEAYRRALAIGGLPSAAAPYARERLSQLAAGRD
jgi:tetratricopeptide (TPR) repeat protein